VSAAAAVNVENLTIAFGAFKAVDDISFCVEAGEIFGFLGANGAGKTTCIRAICGLLSPTAGKITVAGRNVADDLLAIKALVGYMSQRFTLYPDLTVRENIAFAGALRKMPARKILARAKELFRFTGFDYPQDTLVQNLPGGVKQEVALCASLLHDPAIIFLDEPTAGGSPAPRARFWNLIKQLSTAGKTVFVTTHYMDEAEQCGRVSLMQTGRIAALDTPQNLKTANFPHPLYEISPSTAAAPGFAAALAASGAGAVRPWGLRYHLEEQNADLWRKFSAERAGQFSQRRITPTLEDVFLKLVGGSAA